MAENKLRLTDKVCRVAEPPEDGHRSRIYWDTEVAGFGLRVTRMNGDGAEATGGAKSFILDYRVRGSGRKRQYTIGRWGSDYKLVSAARTRAQELRRQIAEGGDPMGALHEYREAPTIADLCDRYLKEHCRNKRASSAAEDRSIIEQIIRPELGRQKVRDIEFADIERLHRKVTEIGIEVPERKNDAGEVIFAGRAGRPAPVRANRAVGVLSKMFNLAITWKIRKAGDGNPCRGIAKNPEGARRRYLSDDELARLVAQLDKRGDHPSAAAVRLALLTGARRGELLSAKWEDIEFKTGKWDKPASTTKQARRHEVPLSAEAQQLLANLYRRAQAKAEKDGVAMSEYVFPALDGESRQKTLRTFWRTLCRDAGIAGLRFHDLRHSFASFLVSAGLDLPVIGELLGHSQVSTTKRYAHLRDEVTRAATERVGALVGAVGKGKPAEVVDLGKRGARG
jgi:integrase